MGPALAAGGRKSRPAVGVSGIAMLLSVLLGWRDHMWLSTEHVIWITVTVVGAATATVVSIVSPAIRDRRSP